MPYKRKYNRRRKKKKLVRRKRKTYVPWGIYPTTKLCKLRYCEEIPMDAAAGGLSLYEFAANGLYDPNLSSTGHQPRQFDEIMKAYDHYEVLGSKITVKHISSSSTTLIPAVFGVALSDTTGRLVGRTLEDIWECRLVKNRNIKQIKGRMHGGEYVTQTFSAKKFFGKARMGDDEMQGSAAANPAEGAIFEIFCSSVDGNNPDRLIFMVTIDYICRFTEPKIITPS